MQQLTLTQAIGKVENLIDTGNGDTGRLYYILEFLKNNRSLYHSDQVYLEKKLGSSFSVEEEPILENNTLPKVQQLIDTGNGDAGRLQHIYDMLANNKPLYYSDQVYLESKLQPPVQEQSIVEVELPKPQPKREYIPPPPKEISKKPESIPEIKGSMPKGWSTNNSKELTTISENINKEEQKIEQQQKISNQINLQRSKLTELVSHRKGNEQKIIQEKLLLESHINDERFRIETQTKLSKEITELEKSIAVRLECRRWPTR